MTDGRWISRRLGLSIICERGDPRDAFVSAVSPRWPNAAGSRVGTSACVAMPAAGSGGSAAWISRQRQQPLANLMARV
jgi:hypothetical protein